MLGSVSERSAAVCMYAGIQPAAGRGNSQPGTDSPEAARYKTIIPVDQLQVRTMASDAHECHGIWEMIQCSADAEARPEKIFQFARSLSSVCMDSCSRI